MKSFLSEVTAYPSQLADFCIEEVISPLPNKFIGSGYTNHIFANTENLVLIFLWHPLYIYIYIHFITRNISAV